MEIFSASLSLSAGNSPMAGEFPAQRPVTQWTLMFIMIWAWTNVWANNREAGDLRCHRAHYNIIVMIDCWKFNFVGPLRAWQCWLEWRSSWWCERRCKDIRSSLWGRWEWNRLVASEGRHMGRPHRRWRECFCQPGWRERTWCWGESGNRSGHRGFSQGWFCFRFSFGYRHHCRQENEN